MNVAIGKIGKSILFDSTKWGAHGGDIDAPVFYENLFHKNPDVNFYIVGASDYCRLKPEHRNKINKHNNVYDLMDGFPQWNAANPKYKENCSHRITFMNKKILPNLPKIDCGLFMVGFAGQHNVVGKTYKKEGVLAKPLCCHNTYTGPYMEFLNKTNIPHAFILNDPRLWPGSMYDLFNPPKIVLSQFDEEIQFKHQKSYKDTTKVIDEIPALYSEVETTFLIGKKDSSVSELTRFLDKPQKDIKMMIVCNEGNPSRYKDLKHYVLDHVKDVDIYGKWNTKTKRISEDNRFKGPKKFNELQSMLDRVKYTFCIPIKKGWVTAKFWEMAHYGIIPFLHPDYDSQDNLNVPEFFRIKDSKDLHDKIELLENDHSEYCHKKNLLDNMLKMSYYDGSKLNETAMTVIKEIVKKYG